MEWLWVKLGAFERERMQAYAGMRAGPGAPCAPARAPTRNPEKGRCGPKQPTAPFSGNSLAVGEGPAAG
ncbi:hypothetical protein SSAG_03726 [Streptomyces sp. Mg1]|nr:hypothetical protein SSAG_03726 [Streptomyces sp. Mg1]